MRSDMHTRVFFWQLFWLYYSPGWIHLIPRSTANYKLLGTTGLRENFTTFQRRRNTFDCVVVNSKNDSVKLWNWGCPSRNGVQFQCFLKFLLCGSTASRDWPQHWGYGQSHTSFVSNLSFLPWPHNLIATLLKFRDQVRTGAFVWYGHWQCAKPVH